MVSARNNPQQAFIGCEMDAFEAFCCLSAGSSKADQVEREVPGQTPERADGGGRQAGSVSTCEFEVFKDISIKPAAFAPVESPNGSCAPPTGVI